MKKLINGILFLAFIAAVLVAEALGQAIWSSALAIDAYHDCIED